MMEESLFKKKNRTQIIYYKKNKATKNAVRKARLVGVKDFHLTSTSVVEVCSMN